MTDTKRTRRDFLIAGAGVLAGLTLSLETRAQQLRTESTEAPEIKESNTSSDRPVVLITGTSTDIGRATALAFAQAGWHTLASMRDVQSRNEAAATDLTQAVQDADLAIDILEIDVTDEASVTQGMAAASQVDGDRINALVNNAAILVPFPVELASPDSMARSFDTNVYGSQRMVRAVAPLMRDRNDGLIINVSSGSGRVTVPLLGTSSATKHALESWSDALRYKLNPFGIEVVVIQPSDTRTNILANAQRYLDQELAALAPSSSTYAAYTKHVAHIETYMEFVDDAAEPESVAAAILDIALQPKGDRPPRTRPGGQLPARINKVAASVQQQVIENGPFSDWSQLSL